MRTITLEMAKQRLGVLLGIQPARLDPDAIDACVPEVQWRPSCLDEASDMAVAESMGMFRCHPREELVIVTDPSFLDNTGAFLAEPNELEQLFSAHRRKFGERVFSGGDVIVWGEMTRRVWLFHHEGVFAVITLGDRGEPLSS